MLLVKSYNLIYFIPTPILFQHATITIKTTITTTTLPIITTLLTLFILTMIIPMVIITLKSKTISQ